MPYVLIDWTNMFIINVQNLWDKNIPLLKSATTSTKRSDKTEVEEQPWKSRWFWADSQSDCSKNMPPSNMRNISCSLTNQIADILYVDDNRCYLNMMSLIRDYRYWSVNLEKFLMCQRTGHKRKCYTEFLWSFKKEDSTVFYQFYEGKELTSIKSSWLIF